MVEADEYFIELAEKDDFENLKTEHYAKTNHLQLSGLKPQSRYSYRVYSVKDGKKSVQVSNTIKTSCLALPTPQNISATAQHAFGFTVRWDKVIEASAYVITRLF